MKKEMIWYAYLTDEQRALVDSKDKYVRAQAAEQGYGLDVLVDDEESFVRNAVARQGYDLEQLSYDPEPIVRMNVVAQGYRLDKFVNDNNEFVRLMVAKRGYGLDKLIDDPDPLVREEVEVYLQDQGVTLKEWIRECPESCALPESTLPEPHDISLRNPVCLRSYGESEVLLFTGSQQVEPFVLAHGYDSITKQWAAGEYFDSLLAATIAFEKQNGTLAYVYTLDHEDILPQLEENGFEPSKRNVHALMLETDDFSAMTDYINENLANANWIGGEIESAESVLHKKGSLRTVIANACERVEEKQSLHAAGREAQAASAELNKQSQSNNQHQANREECL